MNRRITRASTVVAAALLVTGGTVVPAGATDGLNCSATFEAMRTATKAAGLSAADEGGLLRKVTDAEKKYGQHKVDDSLQKLADYASKVQSLVDRHKVGDASGMIGAHGEAVTCVSG